MIDMVVYGFWTACLCLSSFVLVLYRFGDGELGEGCNDATQKIVIPFFVLVPHASPALLGSHSFLLGRCATCAAAFSACNRRVNVISHSG